MQNQSTSARTAAKTRFKSSLLFRPATLAAILMLAAVFSSCGENCVDRFYKLKAPIRIAGTDGKTITVVDSTNTYLVIPEGFYLSTSLRDYKKGDTLVYMGSAK
jgi:hypothetical protein